MRAREILINKLSESAGLLIDDEITIKEAEKYIKLSNKFERLIKKRDAELLDLCDRIENEDISDEDVFVMFSEYMGINITRFTPLYIADPSLQERVTQGGALDIKVGTVVQLNSGGPDMTVKQIGYDDSKKGNKDSILCEWFFRGKYERLRFDIRNLKIIEKE